MKYLLIALLTLPAFHAIAEEASPTEPSRFERSVNWVKVKFNSILERQKEIVNEKTNPETPKEETEKGDAVKEEKEAIKEVESKPLPSSSTIASNSSEVKK